MATVIEQAIDDHRRASREGIIDCRGRPTRQLTPRQMEVAFQLDTFFYGGGMEAALDVAAIKIEPEAIRRKINEHRGRRTKR